MISLFAEKWLTRNTLLSYFIYGIYEYIYIHIHIHKLALPLAVDEGSSKSLVLQLTLINACFNCIYSYVMNCHQLKYPIYTCLTSPFVSFAMLLSSVFDFASTPPPKTRTTLFACCCFSICLEGYMCLRKNKTPCTMFVFYFFSFSFFL